MTHVDQSDMGHLRHHVYCVAQTLNPAECILALDGSVAAETLVVGQVADEVEDMPILEPCFIGVLTL
jgi:hypothetical protein